MCLRLQTRYANPGVNDQHQLQVHIVGILWILQPLRSTRGETDVQPTRPDSQQCHLAWTKGNTAGSSGYYTIAKRCVLRKKKR